MYYIYTAAVVRINIYLIREFGVLNISGEVQNLAPGMVKFSINVSNWEFCGCSAFKDLGRQPGQTNVQLGTVLDINVQIDSPNVAQQRAVAMPRQYTLDSSTGLIILPNKVQLFHPLLGLF